MTVDSDSLKDCNKKVLARMAKDQGIIGWHAMRKDQLIRALTPSLSAALKKDANRRLSPEKIHELILPLEAAELSVAELSTSEDSSGGPAASGPSMPAGSVRTGSSPWSATLTGSMPTGS